MRFNSKLVALAFATTTAIASLSAQANSIEVQVTGTITPGACTPSLGGGGVINYGKIDSSLVKQSAFAQLPIKTVDFTIKCSVPTKVAVQLTDNRSSSIVAGILSGLGAGWLDSMNFGLGSSKGKNIGGYNIRLSPSSYTADGAKVYAVMSSDSGASWEESNGAGAVIKTAGELMSWSATSGGAPIAFESLAGNFSVQPLLNKRGDLDLSDEVELDGSATLELVYL